MRLKAKEVYDMYDAINALSQEKTTMPTAYYIAKMNGCDIDKPFK